MLSLHSFPVHDVPGTIHPNLDETAEPHGFAPAVDAFDMRESGEPAAYDWDQELVAHVDWLNNRPDAARDRMAEIDRQVADLEAERDQLQRIVSRHTASRLLDSVA